MFRCLSNRVHKLMFLLLVFSVSELYPSPVHVMYERFQQNNGTDLIDASNLRIRKFNRTVTVFDGTFDLYHDMDNDYGISLALSYSTLGNNQFILSPFRIPTQHVCTFFNTTYRDYREFYRNTTNLPDVGTCPMVAQQYYIKNKVLNSKLINNYFQPGLWRVDILILKKDSQYPLMSMEVLFKVSKEDIF